MARSNQDDIMTESIVNVQSQRLASLNDMEERIGGTFDNVYVISDVDSISRTTANTIEAKVYEVTVINYHYDDVVGSEDIMAYGVWHDLVIQSKETGYCVTSDHFDETDVTGFSCRSDSVYEDGVAFLEDVSLNERAEITGEGSLPRSGVTYTTGTLNCALAYAIQWCGISESARLSAGFTGQSSTAHSGYNPLYSNENPNGGDCCNFVSQCIHAGGIPTNSTWGYHLEDGIRNGSSAWICTTDFATHFASNYVYCTVPNDYSGVFPGNPVFWLVTDGYPKSHNMFCVGYNSSHVPVLCAHNNELYRIPITNYSDKILHTIKIATSDIHTHTYTYKWNLYKHYRVCSSCEYLASSGVHVVNLMGNCSVCGAHGPFQVIVE